MKPSHVRERILEDHQRLHARLHKLEQSVDALEHEPAQLTTLTEMARSLLEDLVVHTELEDIILAAALCEIDAWGPVRASILRDHHEAQRRELRALIESYGNVGRCEDVARLTLNWIREVRSDMYHEEREVLTRTLLRDDLIAVEMECS